MAEVMGLGLSHYPGPLVPVEYWPNMLKRWVEIGRVRAEDFEDKARWPAPMREEWGEDQGLAAARRHRDRLMDGYRRMREALDAFQPDIVVIFGDDQFENYKLDCVPPYAVGIFEDVVCKPFGGGKIPLGTDENVWGLPAEADYQIACHYRGGLELSRHLLENGVDVSYSRTVRHPHGLAHSFANTVLYLDYDLGGFPYPIIPIHVNCYGNQLIRTSARAAGEGADELSPPAPRPQNCFALGRQVARYFAASPWRVAVIGSSSWSHGSLTPKNGRMYPDVEADRALLADLRSGGFTRWGDLDPEALDDAGQHELLNWVALAGAMSELGLQVEIVDHVETYIFNSSKCFALFRRTAEG